MSAIFGILKHQGQWVEQCDLQKMAQIMSHRGPDGERFWIQGSTGFGHGIFRTTPESTHEMLPFQDSESGFVITADARIDNRDELAKALGLNRAIKEGIPHSHLILYAYQQWGKRCVDHLLGDFAFAIWDQRDKHLFCARDHIGVKPFNYYTDQNSFVFASEVQAVHSITMVSSKINEGRIADFLVDFECIDKTSTFFEKIYRLPPAHTLSIENGRVSIQCYWEPDTEKRIILASDEDYVAAFTEIYTDAIDKRMRGNTDTPSMLSGGIDSSSIVGFARDLHFSKTGRHYPVFSANSTTKNDCRETHYINAVVNQGGLSTHSISIDKLDTLNDEISRVVCAAQEPFDPMIMIIAIYLIAKKSNYRVMLDGVDGDIVASLSSIYPSMLLREGEYGKAINAMSLQSKNYYAGRLSMATIVYQNLRSAYTPEALKKLRRIWQKYSPDKQFNNYLINEKFAKKIDLTDRLARIHTYSSNMNKSIHEMHAKSILHPQLSVALERYDRVAALCGIEPRHPLLDKRVIDFMVGIPWDQKVRFGWNKYLLRKTSESVLEQKVCWRRGWEHIGWNFEQMWLQMNLSNIRTTIEQQPEHIHYYLNNCYLNEIMSGCKSKESIDLSSSVLNINILKLFQLNTWLQNIKR